MDPVIKFRIVAFKFPVAFLLLIIFFETVGWLDDIGGFIEIYMIPISIFLDWFIEKSLE